jgi:hypothetical protein
MNGFGRQCAKVVWFDLGYAQQLFREMGGFSNFAISFSIISILTGAILLFGYGLQFAGWSIVLLGVFMVLYWQLDAKKRFTGPTPSDEQALRRIETDLAHPELNDCLTTGRSALHNRSHE